MMYELRDLGFSTAIGIGGDPVIGTTHIDALAAFEADPETEAIVMIGEIGGDAEERAADYIKAHVTKPVVGYVAGFTAPEGKTMGHAGAIVSGSAGTAEAKKQALEAAGVKVGKTPSRRPHCCARWSPHASGARRDHASDGRRGAGWHRASRQSAARSPARPESPARPRGDVAARVAGRILAPMNRLGTALLAAIEAVGTVGVGLGIAVVPLTLLWGFEYGLQVDWDVFWTAAGSVWLVGHGVDVSFVLGSALAKSSGVSGAGEPIHVTLAALGFAIVTAWLGGRAGRRFAETEHRTTGLLVGTAVVAVLGLAVALSTTTAVVDPVVWQAVVLPALWFAVPALATSEVCRRRRGLPADALTQRVLDQVDRVPTVWRSVVGFGLRAGTAATAAVVTVAGVVVTLLLFTSFAEVIALYERSHAGVVGGIALTVGQLAFLPDFVGWAVAWIVGPGFAIGTGSSVSPVGTVLGPIPGLPVFGALPASGHTFGLVWVLVPVVAGFVVGGLLRPRLVRALGSADTALHRALGGVAAGIVAGLLTGGIAWLTSGSFGPGRLAEVGPHALVVGAFAALEVGVPAAIALAIGSDLVRLPRAGSGASGGTATRTPRTPVLAATTRSTSHTPGRCSPRSTRPGPGARRTSTGSWWRRRTASRRRPSRSAAGTAASSDRDDDGDGDRRDRDGDGDADRVPARPASPVVPDTAARTHSDGPADADGSADADRPTPVTGPARARDRRRAPGVGPHRRRRRRPARRRTRPARYHRARWWAARPDPRRRRRAPRPRRGAARPRRGAAGPGHRCRRRARRRPLRADAHRRGHGARARRCAAGVPVEHRGVRRRA